ncbi:MAG: dihydroorotase [Nitrospinae bacterium]|nr:dihydroorotase [Nitrospinota bacterium]
MSAILLIKNGRILDPASGFDQTSDILIKDGRIVEIRDGIEIPTELQSESIDARGLIVVPGFIDIHTHLREPGFEHKETIATGAEAAAAGGFTSIACMANTRPVNDSTEITGLILRKAREAGLLARVYPIAAITIGLQGKTLSPMKALKDAGAVAFSDDGSPVSDDSIMELALEAGKRLGVPIISHCETRELAHGGVMNEGPFSRRLGLKGIPNESEDRMAERDIRLAGKTGGHVHIAHVSTAGTVQLVRDAKRAGIKVTCEAAPHHFTLSDEDVSRDNPNTKMNPPLRSWRDVDAVLEGLADGTIDAIATDHAPHSQEEKARGFEEAPFGIVGLETALPLVLSLVRDKVISLNRAISLMAFLPAKIMGLDKGRLRVGDEADLAVFDPEREWTVDPASFKSKGKNTPFVGWKVKGKVCFTIAGGKIVYRERAQIK